MNWVKALLSRTEPDPVAVSPSQEREDLESGSTPVFRLEEITFAARQSFNALPLTPAEFGQAFEIIDELLCPPDPYRVNWIPVIVATDRVLTRSVEQSLTLLRHVYEKVKTSPILEGHEGRQEHVFERIGQIATGSMTKHLPEGETAHEFVRMECMAIAPDTDDPVEKAKLKILSRIEFQRKIDGVFAGPAPFSK